MQFALTPTAILIILAASTFTAHAGDNFKLSNDDGTYKTITVKSAKECNKLCKAERDVCRGSLLLEEMTIEKGKVKSVKQCRLNDGLSPKSPFKITPPKPLDLHIALTELNAYRAKKGRKALKLNNKLNRASQAHAQDLAQNGLAAHVGTDGSSHGQRVKRQGYNYQTIAENVATGQKSWEQVFQAWKDSSGHNKNLLAKDVDDFGIALVYEPTTTYTTYWTMLVGTELPKK